MTGQVALLPAEPAEPAAPAAPGVPVAVTAAGPRAVSAAGPGARRVVWKFGGTSVGDPARLRAVAQRLVAAHRRGIGVVAVLSAMGDATDDLVRMAYDLSPQPQPRELDALLSVGESVSCALAAIAIHHLGEQAISLSGPQAGMLTDDSYGNARLREINPRRVVEALDAGAVVLVTGFQGISAGGDVTTLGRGGSDASAIALAAALGLSECDIFTDVAGVFTADPRLVPGAQRLDRLGHEEMLQLAEAGAQVLQPRAVELAAAHGIDIHVRSTFTTEPGTWIRKGSPMFENTRIAGVAHRRHDPVYLAGAVSLAGVSQAAVSLAGVSPVAVSLAGVSPVAVSPAVVSSALARRGVPVGAIIRDDEGVRFTAPGTDTAEVIAALGDIGVAVTVRGGLGSVSVVGTVVGNRPEITTRILSTLERAGIDPHLVTSTPGRVSCHIPAAAVEQAARLLHDAFDLHLSDARLSDAHLSDAGRAGAAVAVSSHAG